MKMKTGTKIILNVLALFYMGKAITTHVLRNSFSPTAETALQGNLQLTWVIVLVLFSVVASHLSKNQIGVLISALPIAVFGFLETNFKGNFLQILGKDYKHPYLVGISAPKQFPIFGFEGTILDVMGNEIQLPHRVWEQSGLGTVGHIHLDEPREKSLPAFLNLKWYSLVEDRSFQISTALPTQKIKALFQSDQNEMDKIITAIRPGGSLSLLISGPEVTKELAVFDATEFEIQFSELFFGHPSRENHRFEMLKNFKINIKDSTELSRLYSFRRKWNVTFKGNKTPDRFKVIYWNGERGEFEADPLLKPAPKEFMFRWNSQKKFRHFAFNPSKLQIFLENSDSEASNKIEIDPDDLSHIILSNNNGLKTKLVNEYLK